MRLVSSLHGHCSSLDMVLHVTLTTVITCMSDTQIWYRDYCYTNMLHVYTDRIHGYSLVYMHCLFIYILAPCIFLPIIPLHDRFPLLLLIFSLLDMSVVDTQCVELSAKWISATGSTSRIPHLLYIVSRYLVS